MTAIALDTLNGQDRAAFTADLGDIFEHAPWVAAAIADQRPFRGVAALFAAMRAAVRAAPEPQRQALIAGHPDLAGKAAQAGSLTAESTGEQASAGLDRLSDAEFATFHRLNDAYQARFGIPFIVCVRRHTKDSILRQFERRLLNDPAVERETALAEVFRIAAVRLDARVRAPDRLDVVGRLSTHVLDTVTGRPADGVAIELAEISASGVATTIVETKTNLDGRTDAPLIGGRPVPIGTYALRFSVGNYFARTGAAVADPPFLDVVTIQFGVAEAEAHYHVPLLVSPWSYSTYRGS